MKLMGKREESKRRNARMKMKAMMVMSLAVFAATAAEDCVKSATVPRMSVKVSVEGIL